MKYKDYEQFVINYKPFEWEVRDYDFRETIRSKHNFLMSFIRFYKVNNYLDILLNEKNLKNPNGSVVKGQGIRHRGQATSD